jgi:predicted  nucleic acid-binding Zn-ribbon protein
MTIPIIGETVSIPKADVQKFLGRLAELSQTVIVYEAMMKDYENTIAQMKQHIEELERQLKGAEQ